MMLRSRTLERLSVLALTLGPSVASAGEDVPSTMLFGQEVKKVAPLDEGQRAQRAQAFERMLEQNGWTLIDDQVRPMGPDGGFAQPSAPVGDSAEWTTPPHRTTIFLNFFGDTLEAGSNAALNKSPCISGGQLEYPGFGGTEQQALSLIQVFETLMEPYGVRIAYAERPPAHLPYAMVMMGGTPDLLGLPGGVLGVSCSSDCGDFWWRDLTFAFTDSVGNNNAEELGTTALHEAAHAFGLAHIDGSENVMFPFVNPNVNWAEQCTAYNDATGGINCQPTHDEFCEGGAQNSSAELFAYFGENSVDLDPPVVEILSPTDGLELETGASVTVEADVTDNHEGVGWKLMIIDAASDPEEVLQEAVAYGFEREWPLGDLPQGSYTLRVAAIDHDRNEASDEVTIYVGVEAPDEQVDSTQGDSASGDTMDATATEGDSDDGGQTAGQGGVTAGCSCRTTDAWPGAGAGMMLLLLGLFGRVRRSSSVTPA